MASSRPKGFMDNWKPKPHIALVLDQVKEILAEYASYGPMTVRQVFYRLVGNYGYAKTERDYKNLAEWLVKARRAQIIKFGRIRDDGTIVKPASGNESRQEVWDYLLDILRKPSRYHQLDRQMNQPQYIELWCEAAGMAPMLAGMVRNRNIPVYSTGGFSSVTVTYETAQRVASRDKPTYFLHVGDFDPSGESIFTSMSQDIGAFVVGQFGGRWNSATGETTELSDGKNCLFVPRRVALTEEQVFEHDLPTAPPKMSDSRSANWFHEATQLEAMPPDLLEGVLTEYIDEILDHDLLQETEDKQAEDEERLDEAVMGQSVESIIEELGLADPSVYSVVEEIANKDMEEE